MAIGCLFLSCAKHIAPAELMSAERQKIVAESIENSTTSNISENIPEDITSYNKYRVNFSTMCSYINDLYESLEYYHMDRTEYEYLWRTKNKAIDSFLLLLFISEESLSMNIKNELPFLSCIVSEDNLVKVYSWYTENDIHHSWSNYHSIIQYIRKDGTLGAELILDGLADATRFLSTSDSYLSLNYLNIYKLKDSVYLLHGYMTNDNSDPKEGTYTYAFITVEIQNYWSVFYPAFESITHYSAFTLPVPITAFRYSLVDEKNQRLATDAFVYFNTEGNCIIQINYAELIISDKTFKNATDQDYKKKYWQFVFDGTKFSGDYNAVEKLWRDRH